MHKQLRHGALVALVLVPPCTLLPCLPPWCAHGRSFVLEGGSFPHLPLGCCPRRLLNFHLPLHVELAGCDVHTQRRDAGRLLSAARRLRAHPWRWRCEVLPAAVPSSSVAVADPGRGSNVDSGEVLLKHEPATRRAAEVELCLQPCMQPRPVARH